MFEPNTLLNDRYRLIEEVGEGGMASVYRAIDTRLGRTVALKLLHRQYLRDEPFLRRFQQEAEFAASLGAHPNIVAIYDIGQDASHSYIVMEFVEGRSLKELIQEKAPFSVPEAFAIGQQVASALDFAHKRGLIHRDVKPQNIMVTPEGVAKVTDFGIARSVSASQLTRTGMVIGTVHYFSPEQAQGQPAQPASDIYSLGVILFEMLTGHLLFDAENPIGVAMQHVHSEPPSPWTYNPALPARAVATVMRALEKDPTRRYRDAAEFASALSEAATADTGATTVFAPIPQREPAVEHTALYTPVEPVRVVPSQPPVEEEPVVVVPRSRPLPPPNRWRTAWLALGALLLALLVGLGSFFAANHVLGTGASATSTPTSTPKPTPKPRKRTPTPAPVFPVATVPPRPIVYFTPVPPTPTPTPLPPPPTRPPPKPTPKPTSVPPTPVPTGPTPTPTAVG